jgi:hypothetical protein
MILDIPSSAQVLILVGDRPTRSPIGEVSQSIEPARSRGRPLLKTSIAAAVMAIAFLAGQHVGSKQMQIAQADGATATLTAAPDRRAFPDRPLPATRVAPDQIPPAFAQTLRQPPVVTPVPGAPPTAPASAAHPFGLED